MWVFSFSHRMVQSPYRPQSDVLMNASNIQFACFQEWLDLSSAFTRKKHMKNVNASGWCSSFPYWCLPCSQFLDMMDTIDRQKEEITKSGRWVLFLSAFCSSIAELSPLHFLPKTTHLSFPPKQMQDIRSTTLPASGSTGWAALHYEFTEGQVWRRKTLPFPLLCTVQAVLSRAVNKGDNLVGWLVYYFA